MVILFFPILSVIILPMRSEFQRSQPINRNLREAEKAAVERLNKLMSIKGKQTASSFHKRLGKIMWDYVGMTRNEAGLKKALELIQ